MPYYNHDRSRVYLEPISEAQAIADNKTRWRDTENPCPHCGTIEPVLWVGLPGMCNKCVMEAFILSLQPLCTFDKPYSFKQKTCPKGPHIFKTTINNHTKCTICEELKFEAKRVKAIATGRRPPPYPELPAPTGDVNAGYEWYVPDDRCKQCGTTAPRSDTLGMCQGCISTKASALVVTPRQAAIAAREMWYVPTTPCDKCCVIAPKRVNNGECKACSGLTDADNAMIAAGTNVGQSTAAYMGINIYWEDGEWHWL